MSVTGKVVSFYFEKGTKEVKNYTTGSGKVYRMGVVWVEKLGINALVRVYDTNISINSSVEIQPLVNTDSGEQVFAADGQQLFSCLLNTTTDNSKLSALFSSETKSEQESTVLSIDDSVPSTKKS